MKIEPETPEEELTRYQWRDERRPFEIPDGPYKAEGLGIWGWLIVAGILYVITRGALA